VERLDGSPASCRAQLVDLVKSDHARLVGRPQLAQLGLHRQCLVEGGGIGDVDDLEHQVGVGDLLQGGPEGDDDVGRQLLDEAHGIGEQNLPA